MEIIDIQERPTYGSSRLCDRFEITFDDGDGNDGMKVMISRDDMFQISDYCSSELSYAAQIRKGQATKPYKSFMTHG